MNTAIGRRNTLDAVIAVMLVFTVSTVDAQTCSQEEAGIRAQYEAASLEALRRGDMNRYRDMKLSLEGELSPSCRRLLDEVEPMRVQCSAQEKELVLQHYSAVFQAAQNLDVMRVIDVMLHLEAEISQQCWVAANRHIDPQVVAACTGRELDHIASFAGPTLRMTRGLLTGSNVDLNAALTLGQGMTAPLSQGCNQALANIQQPPGPAPDPFNYGPRNVIDHGGGTYSVPGTGACSSAGCIAY